MHRRWIAPLAVVLMFASAAAMRIWGPVSAAASPGTLGVRSLAAMLLFPVSGLVLLAIFAALARAAPRNGDHDRATAIWARVANVALLLHLGLHLSLIASALR